MAAAQPAIKRVPVRPLGSQGLVAPIQGLGTMGMTAFYTGVEAEKSTPEQLEAEALATIDKAVELGINFLDTAWIYKNATAHNETLVGKAIKKHGRENLIIATKFGIDFSNPANPFDASEATIRKQLAESLERLGTDYIDLYYQHRQDPNTPIEQVAATLKKLVEEKKIKYIGFSEVTGKELERAHAVHPVTAIQMEWSLATRDLEAEVVPAARKLGVAIVAYSPLCRGLLSQLFVKREELASDDWRLVAPRFSEENIAANAASAAKLAALAQSKGLTPAQLALAWVHNQGPDVFPIPGTKQVRRLVDNAAAAFIQLTPEEMREIESLVKIVGDRYAAGMAGSTFNNRVQNL